MEGDRMDANTDRIHVNNDWSVRTESEETESGVQRRRYVRLEITSPIQLRLLVSESEESSEIGQIPFSGEVLNVSGGGVLVQTAEAVPEDGYVLMDFELNGTDRVSGVVGRVKRCEEDDENIYLVGVEFCSAEDIEENCPENFKSQFADDSGSFNDKVRELINRYVFNQRVQRKSRENWQ
jgi:hypothetical protein